MKKARNNFEAYVRTQGITKRKFGEITGVSGTTIDKYLENPTMLRIKHLSLLAKQQEVEEKDLLRLIKENEYDI